MKKLKNKLEQIMKTMDVSTQDEKHAGFRAESFSYVGEFIVCTLNTYHGWPGEADNTQYFIYNDGILRLDTHSFSDDAMITGREEYSVEEFLDVYKSFSESQKEELENNVEILVAN